MALDCSTEFLALVALLINEKHLCVYLGKKNNKCVSGILRRVGLGTHFFFWKKKYNFMYFSDKVIFFFQKT